MSFDKAIKHGKERKEYRDQRRQVSRSARGSSGTDSYAQRGRRIDHIRTEERAKFDLKADLNDE